jgi:hypothetical protein
MEELFICTGYVETCEKTKCESAVVASSDTKRAEEIAKEASDEATKIGEAAKKVAAEPNQPTKAVLEKPQDDIRLNSVEARQPQTKTGFKITFKQLAWLIRFLNFVLIPTAVLYCLTMLFTLKVSLLGRLGGINHICRAFFLSLVMVVLLLPWQRFFAGIVVGAIYTPAELVRWYTVETTGGIFGIIFYYLRFTGYWLLVLLLVIFSQLRSMRWAKAILRRLEII